MTNISMRKSRLGYVSLFSNNLWNITQSDKRYQNLTWKPSTLYHKKTTTIYSPSYCIKHTWSESEINTLQRIYVFLLPGHSSKHCGTAVIHYTDCKSTNSPYFKEQMTKCMKIHKILLKDCSLTAYMMTTNFENTSMYTGTWIYFQ
jgi:hypothetical protein